MKFCYPGKSENACAAVSNTFRGGLVYLCPCIRMSYREKLRLISQLKRNPCQGRESSEETNPWHECIKTYDSTTVHVQLRPSLKENRDLLVQTHFEITWKHGYSRPKHLPYFCCAHVDLIKLISEGKNSHECGRCDTLMAFSETRTEDKHRCSIRTLRNLGAGEAEASLAWYDQTCESYYDPSRFRTPVDHLNSSFSTGIVSL